MEQALTQLAVKILLMVILVLDGIELIDILRDFEKD